MNFIGRKIYFDKVTGNSLLDTGEMCGDVRETTVNEDFMTYIELAKRTKDSVGVIKLGYGFKANEFGNCTGYRIDLETNNIVFSFTAPEATLEEVKQAKIQELENCCTKVKDRGFKSSCLGTEKIFDSSPENRNLIIGLAMKASLVANGATLADSNIDWKSAGEPVCYPWQPQQMIILGVDMSTFLTNTIKHKEQLQQYVSALKTVEEVQKVTWDTVIRTT